MRPADTKKNKRFNIPWWIYIIIAATGYWVLKYLLPAWAKEHTLPAAMLELASQLAPVFAMIFFLLAGVALYQDDETGESSSSSPAEDDEKPEDNT